MSNTWKPRGWLADRQQTKELRASNQRVASFGWRRTKDTWGLPTATWILHGKVYMKVQFCFTTRAVVVNPSTMNKRNQKNNLATEHAETQSKLTWDPWRTPLPATRLHQRRLLDLLVPRGSGRWACTRDSLWSKASLQQTWSQPEWLSLPLGLLWGLTTIGSRGLTPQWRHKGWMAPWSSSASPGWQEAWGAPVHCYAEICQMLKSAIPILIHKTRNAINPEWCKLALCTL